MQATTHRVEERIPLTVRVDLCSLDVRHPTQEGVTENVSTHGVRVVSNNPWKCNQRLNLWCLPGDFRARARVVYCEPLGARSFAIGLQVLASSGGWK
jgi:PilZ domain